MQAARFMIEGLGGHGHPLNISEHFSTFSRHDRKTIQRSGGMKVWAWDWQFAAKWCEDMAAN